MSAFSDYYANANENWFGIDALRNRIANKAHAVKQGVYNTTREMRNGVGALRNRIVNKAHTVEQVVYNATRKMRNSAVNRVKTMINPLIKFTRTNSGVVLPGSVLVVGAHPDDAMVDLRDFHDDEHYYMLDIREPTGHPRFIHANLSDNTKMTEVSSTFKHKFDITIMDCGVAYYISSDITNVVQHLIQMTKPGGNIIIPYQFVHFISHIKGETQENRHLRKARLSEGPLHALRSLGLQLEIKPIMQIINENEAARRIYGNRTDNCPNDAIVITVPTVSGGKYKSRRHKKTNRSKTHRR